MTRDPDQCLFTLRFLRGFYRGRETAGNFFLEQNESFLLPEDKEELVKTQIFKKRKGSKIALIIPLGRSDLVDLQEAVDLAAFVLLLLHLLRESLPLALLDGVGVLEGPASPPVRLPHIVTGVAAPAHDSLSRVANQKVFSFHIFLLSFPTTQPKSKKVSIRH